VDEQGGGGWRPRRIESWHYTDLRALLRAVPAAQPAPSLSAVRPLVSGASVLMLRQGAADAVTAPEGVTIRRYADSLVDGTAAEGLREASADDAIGRINGSFVRDGLVLEIADGAELAAPLEIQSLHGAGQVHTRFPVRFGADSKATVIERHRGEGDEAALVSSISALTLGNGAEVTWIVLQEQGAADTHLGQIRVELGADAKLRLFVVNAGGKLVRQELRITVSGEGSELTLRGVNLLGGDTHTDVTLVLDHNVPHTNSTEIIRNVIFDRARGVFQGMIRVAQAAQKTDAKMACNTLLLSDDADFSVKPELEIFADDVLCGHGATVADIDRNHMYYMMTRGVPEKTARAMLVYAFVAQIVEELDEESLVEALEGIISAWLEMHA